MKTFSLTLLIFVFSTSVAEADSSIALIVQPARGADAAKVAQIRTLLAAEFSERKMPQRRFLASYEPQTLEDAREKLKAARTIIAQDVSMQRTQQAQVQLMGAFFGFKSVLGDATTDELAEMFRGLALTKLMDSDVRQATMYLRSSLNLISTQRESRYRASPKFLALYQEQLALLPGLPTGTVRVESNPRGAEVYVNDELKGFTPMTIQGLSEGGHLIRLKQDGYYTHGWHVDVVAKKLRKLAYTLKPIPGNSKHQGWLKALHSKRSWKKPDTVVAAMKGLARVYKTRAVVALKVSKVRKAYRLTGAIFKPDTPPEQIDEKIVVDATFLKQVKSLAGKLFPVADKAKPEPVQKLNQQPEK